MKWILIALPLVAAAAGAAACNSDDSSTPAVTVLANVPAGGACDQTVQCVEGDICGYKAGACPAGSDAAAALGTCIPQGTCVVMTECPCGDGPAFSECVALVNGATYVSEPVTGDLSCAPPDAGEEGGGDAGPGDAAAEAASEAGDEEGDGSANDAGSDASSDAAADASSDAGSDAGGFAVDAAVDAPRD